MSPRLIKNDGGDAAAIVSYTIPQADGASRQAGAETAPCSAPVRHVVPHALDKTASAAATKRPPAFGANSLEKSDVNLEETRAEAERLIRDAETRAAEIEQEARARGLAEGRAASDAEIAEAVASLRDKLGHALAEVANLRAEVAVRAERDLIRLAVEIAKKIIHREVTVDGEIALTLARVALSRVHNRAVATVRLHPDDHAYVTTRVARLEGHGSLELVADASVGRGGCLVQAEMGDVDARIEQQFAEIERGFFGG